MYLVFVFSKDEVMKSNFYEDYIFNVSAEVTLDIVAEIIQRRRNKISKNILRERQFDKELDAPETVLTNIEAHMVDIGEQTRRLKLIYHHSHSCMSAMILHPQVSIESVSADVTRDIVAEIVERSKNKISESYIREKYQPHFPRDKRPDLKHIESYMAAIGNPQQLKKGHLCETSAEVPHPLVTLNQAAWFARP
ncbi:hypothetical protein LINGRAHAP2_LOCUS5602 [Linum grandiflorum]